MDKGNAIRLNLEGEGRSSIRNDIELFRCISAFGIICFHNGGPGGSIGYAGLIFFLIISIYLSARSRPKTVGDRVIRFLAPWAFWYVVFALFRTATGKSFLEPNLSLIESVLVGSGGHLWYLPFALIAVLGVDLAKKHIPDEALCYVSGVAAVAYLLAVPWWREPSLLVGKPWAQYAHAAPAVLIGLFLATSNRVPKFMAYLFAFALLGAAAHALSFKDVGLVYMLGIAICSVLVFNPEGLRFLNRYAVIPKLSRYTFGIYLAHPLFLAVFSRLHLHGVWWVPAVVFVVSALTVATIARFFPIASKYVM